MTYIPFRLNYSRCGKCPRPVSLQDSTGRYFITSTNTPSHIVQTQRYSLIISSAIPEKRRKTRIIKKDLNAFRRWEGAPGGSGEPPRNTF